MLLVGIQPFLEGSYLYLVVEALGLLGQPPVGTEFLPGFTELGHYGRLTLTELVLYPLDERLACSLFAKLTVIVILQALHDRLSLLPVVFPSEAVGKVCREELFYVVVHGPVLDVLLVPLLLIVGPFHEYLLGLNSLLGQHELLPGPSGLGIDFR